MNWKKWLAWNEKKYIVVILFAIAYISTIPIRDYGFLAGFVDITKGVPILAHLIIIVMGAIVVLILLKIIETIVKSVLKR